MEILGIGPLELFFILIIALIVLGPNDMVKTGRMLGRWLRKVVTSPGWQTVQQTSRDIRYLPNKLMREAGMEEIKDQLPKSGDLRREMGLNELEKDVNKWQRELSDWTTPPSAGKTSASDEKAAPEEAPEALEEPAVSADETPEAPEADTSVEPESSSAALSEAPEPSPPAEPAETAEPPASTGTETQSE